MKLLITTQVLDRDDLGYFGFFHAWVEEFAKHCESVIVVCLREGAHSLPPNVRVYSAGKGRGVSRIGRWWNILRYIVVLRHQYDTVLVHMNPEYLVWFGWLWKAWGKKTALWYLHRSAGLRLRIAVLFADKVLSASRESFPFATPVLTIVGHGIDPSFTPQPKTPSDTLRVVYWGRLSPSKQIEKIIAAVAAVRATRPATLTLIGAPGRPSDGPYVESLKKQAAQAGGVTFTGGVPHYKILGYLAEADVCVNVSTTQSMDKTVLEAMAAGVPVVSSNNSFRGVLEPLGLFVSDLSPAALANSVVRAATTDVAVLIEYVRREHSLQALIPKILAAYEKTR